MQQHKYFNFSQVSKKRFTFTPIKHFKKPKASKFRLFLVFSTWTSYLAVHEVYYIFLPKTQRKEMSVSWRADINPHLYIVLVLTHS